MMAALAQNIEAEQAFLGALLLNNAAADTVRGFLLAEHFSSPVHGRIYEAALENIDRNLAATPITLKPRFDSDPELEDAGGSKYLARLAGAAVSLRTSEAFARTILENYQIRQLNGLAAQIAEATGDDSQYAPDQVIENIEISLAQIASGGYSGSAGAVSMTAAADALVSHLEAEDSALGVSSGFQSIDQMLGGLMRGSLFVIGGRPSMGKSAIGLAVAVKASSRGANGAFFSLEMPHRELVARATSQIMAGWSKPVPYTAILKRNLDEMDRNNIPRALSAVRDLAMHIDDTPGRTAQAIKAQCRRINRRLAKDGKSLDFIVVDHLTLMRDSGRYRDNRNNQIGEITAELKALAKEMDICVVLLCQLNRGVEGREDKRPQLSDLRESGSIEQDADQVAFIFREEYYLKRHPAKPGSAGEDAYHERLSQCENTAELLVQKNRNGPAGIVRLYCDIANNYFSELHK